MRIKESSSKEEKEEPAKKLTVPVNISSDHILGSGNNITPITLVEYGDYECPYTDIAYPLLPLQLTTNLTVTITASNTTSSKLI